MGISFFLLFLVTPRPGLIWISVVPKVEYDCAEFTAVCQLHHA